MSTPTEKLIKLIEKILTDYKVTDIYPNRGGKYWLGLKWCGTVRLIDTGIVRDIGSWDTITEGARKGITIQTNTKDVCYFMVTAND